MTQEQRDNLIKLATYLLDGDLKAHFNMLIFHDSVENSYSTLCGTIGCAVGHGPYAGVPKHPTESWSGYAHRVFGASITVTGDLFTWAFSEDWHQFDSTPEGAGKRIIYYLKHGARRRHPSKDNIHLYKNLSLADLEK